MRFHTHIVLLSTVVAGGLGLALASSCKEPMLMACCTEISNPRICEGDIPCGNIRTSGEEIEITALGFDVKSGGFKFESVELKGTCVYDMYACDGLNGCVYQDSSIIGCFSAEGLSCPI